jgi:hypothetical protein
MNMRKLIENELFRISKEIKTTLRNDGDKRQLIFEAVEKYDLNKDEEIRLNVLLAY